MISHGYGNRSVHVFAWILYDMTFMG